MLSHPASWAGWVVVINLWVWAATLCGMFQGRIFFFINYVIMAHNMHAPLRRAPTSCLDMLRWHHGSCRLLTERYKIPTRYRLLNQFNCTGHSSLSMILHPARKASILHDQISQTVKPPTSSLFGDCCWRCIWVIRNFCSYIQYISGLSIFYF